MSEYTFSLVLPTYNPGPTLRDSLRELIPFAIQNPSWEIIFVCDGCSDGSDRVLEEFARHHFNVRVIKFSRNSGKGHAVRIGMLRARGRYRIFTDVDLAYPLSMVESVAEQLLAGNEVVIASRAHPESQIDITDELKSYMGWRKSQSHIFSTAARKLLGIRQRDPQAGLKGLSARAAAMLLPLMKCNGFGFDCELLVAARFFGLHVREVPIQVRYSHKHTSTRLRTTLRMAVDLWKIRQRWRRLGWKGLPKSVLEVAAAAERAHAATPKSNRSH